MHTSTRCSKFDSTAIEIPARQETIRRSTNLSFFLRYFRKLLLPGAIDRINQILIVNEANSKQVTQGKRLPTKELDFTSHIFPFKIQFQDSISYLFQSIPNVLDTSVKTINNFV